MIEVLHFSEGEGDKVQCKYEGLLQINFPILKDLSIKRRGTPDQNSTELLTKFIVKHSSILIKVAIKVDSSLFLQPILKNCKKLEYLHYSIEKLNKTKLPYQKYWNLLQK